MSSIGHLLKLSRILLISFALAALLPAVAFAQTTVAPSGDETGATDRRAIQNAISTDGDVVLQSGATYYTDANLKVRDNTTIRATGATIVAVNERSGAFRNSVKQNGYAYDSCKNVKVIGGYWKHVNENGYQHSMIQFTHASNIELTDLAVEGSFEHHAIELIACKDVTISGCTVKSIGKCGKSAAEDAIQIDVATPKTAPTVKKNYGEKAVNGQTCQNITIKNCKVLGSRGIAANRTRESKYAGKCHKNITVTGCTVIGTSSEALAIFNTIGKINVSNNTLVSYSTRTNTSYSLGLHFALFGKVAKKSGKTIKATVKNNVIKGGRQGMFVCSHAGKTRMGKFTVTKNKAYAKAGKNKAIVNSSAGASKFTSKKNKTFKWTSKQIKSDKATSLAEFETVKAPSAPLVAATATTIV